MSKEQAVRDAAADLHAAIVDAEAAGYRVDWPITSLGLPTIAVSETGRMGAAAKPAPGDEYEHMTKASLVDLAVARGVDVKSDWNKSDYITALRG